MKKTVIGLVIGLGLFFIAMSAMAVDDLELKKAVLTTNLWQQQAYNTQILLLQERLVILKNNEEQLRAEIQKLTAKAEAEKKAKTEAEKKAKEEVTKDKVENKDPGGK